MAGEKGRIPFLGVAGCIVAVLVMHAVDEQTARDQLTAAVKTESALYTVPPGGEKDADWTWQPPMRFQGSLLTAVYFTDPADIIKRCGGASREGVPVACEDKDPFRKPVIVAVNPCTFERDDYALMLCHEIGHGHGWKHEDGHRGRAAE